MSAEIKKALEQLAARWDGKEKAAPEAFYTEYAEQVGFLKMLMQALDDSALQALASWLLKHAHDQGRRLGKAQQKQLLAVFSQADDWQTRLHFLQILPYLTVPEAQAEMLREFLLQGVNSSNKFVRAWSYGGYLQLAQQHPQFLEEARQFAEMAMRDEAPSVKARLRQLGVSV